MSRRDLERKLNELTNRLSRLSIEQRQITIELVEVTEELAGRSSNTEAYQQRETLPEHNRGDRIVITNSKNRHEKRATVTRTDGNKAHFRFDSGRLTWRLKHNVRPIREEEENS